jgi:hypothetical protein
VDFFGEGEAEGGCVKGFLGRGGIAKYGERDVIGGVVVFVLDRTAISTETVGELVLEWWHTRKYLNMLISPKRCSIRNTSRLSDRFAGRGTILKCTESAGSDAARRTDMIGL